MGGPRFLLPDPYPDTSRCSLAERNRASRGPDPAFLVLHSPKIEIKLSEETHGHYPCCGLGYRRRVCAGVRDPGEMLALIVLVLFRRFR